MTAQAVPSFQEVFSVFLRIGLLSFGGPAAQIALMHRFLVEERGWLDERQFLNALSFCMLLPGPEAMQLATYAGWRLHGLRGGLCAGLLFVLPGAVVIFALAGLYVAFGQLAGVTTLFLGVQAAAVVIVIAALIKLARRALTGRAQWGVAVLAFVAIFFLSVPFPVIVLLAGGIGALLALPGPGPAKASERARPVQTLRVVAMWLVIWCAPFVLLWTIGAPDVLPEIGLFFSKLAVVTFGGAYAVLAYMAQDVVAQLGWLSATEMMDGLGLAETTPGPLILVTQFVGFLAGYGQGGYGLAFAGALMALWVTFVPCFLWIFAGAPYVEALSAQPRLGGALRMISAAVVGVMLNLSVWFALHVVFQTVTPQRMGAVALWVPDWTSLRFEAVALIGLCAYLLIWRHLSVAKVLIAAAIAALGLSAL